jgi:SSS family solute:Na+ symporter
MTALDWLIVILPLAAVFAVAAYTNRYVTSVADFLSAGRCAGRYLLANAKGESESGLSSSISSFEIILVSGFVLDFWDRVSYPVSLLVAITGFVVYRYRETRALTLAQFFEIRYTRRFRLFMGGLAFASGILNYGVFPAISSRFFIYFLGLPLTVHVGPLAVSTFVLIMAGYLAVTVALVLIGGQATMMVTCCLEGLLSQLIYVVIAVALVYLVSWHRIAQTLTTTPPGQSLVNPFDSGQVHDFNYWFTLMAICTRVYSTMAMQQKQGFNSAARTPHEGRMGGVLGEWRSYARKLMLVLLGICAITFLRHPAFAGRTADAHRVLASIPSAYLRQQLSVPVALRYLLPAGIKGLFVAVMVMGLLSGDGGHLHSWGSIFIQDVVLPLRKAGLTPGQHIWLLRAAVCGVAVFALLFSTFFPQTQYIQLWWLLTASVFVGGAGAAIIGGLYWRRGTAAAAWAAAITGSVLGVSGIVCGHFWPDVTGGILHPLGLRPPAKFWLNDQQSGFIAACTAASVYVIVSFVTCRTPFNLERMLHRGPYATGDGDHPASASVRRRFSLGGLLKFDDDFSRSDKVLAGGIFWWSVALAAVNAGIGAYNLTYHRWPTAWWLNYWLVLALAIPFVVSIVTLVWFTIGGIGDLRKFYLALRTERRDTRDDGRVAGHHSLADEGRGTPVVEGPGSNSPSSAAMPPVREAASGR